MDKKLNGYKLTLRDCNGKPVMVLPCTIRSYLKKETVIEKGHKDE